jgi:hypothetical protein
MRKQGVLVCLTGMILGCSLQLAKADLAANDLGSILKGQDWASRIASYQFTLRSYSESNPQKAFLITYREKGPQYYYHSSFQSDQPAAQNSDVIDISESWDGATAMFLSKSTGTLLVGKQPFAFKPPWRLVCGLFFPFRFVLNHQVKDTIETPQLKDIVGRLSDFSHGEMGVVTDEIKNNEPYVCLTTDGGFDFLTREQVKVKTYFSKKNNFYPTIIEMYDKDGKLKDAHTVEALKFYPLDNGKASIPYPAKLRSVYYSSSTGAVTNTVITEYSDVTFNAAGIEGFQLDPIQARTIYDEKIRKVIAIPQ